MNLNGIIIKMSIQTWIEEFYPITAETFISSFKFRSDINSRMKELYDIELLKHALLKWEGLRKDNLKKHNVYKSYNSIKDIHSDINQIKELNEKLITNQEISISSVTCTLCIEYDHNIYCGTCPIRYKTNQCSTGNIDIFTNETRYAYGEFLHNDDPEPMIKILKETIIELEESLKNE